MNPHISLPRPTGGPSNFGSTPSSSRRSEVRMPRFFKRLFKFPQMDFEMAIWEIMSLVIAPKKVFRQIYYHVCLISLSRQRLCLTLAETNYKNIPPTRPILHIPPLLPPHPYITRLGLRIRQRLHANTTHNARLHFRALLTIIAGHCDTVLLPGWTTTRTRELVAPRQAERAVQSERGRRWKGRARIWVLLGRSDTSVRTCLGIPLCCAILVHAACGDGSLVSNTDAYHCGITY